MRDFKLRRRVNNHLDVAGFFQPIKKLVITVEEVQELFTTGSYTWVVDAPGLGIKLSEMLRAGVPMMSPAIEFDDPEGVLPAPALIPTPMNPATSWSISIINWSGLPPGDVYYTMIWTTDQVEIEARFRPASNDNNNNPER